MIQRVCMHDRLVVLSHEGIPHRRQFNDEVVAVCLKAHELD